MDFAKEIEREKKALLEALDTSVGAIAIDSLLELIECMDPILREHLGQCLTRYAPVIFNASTINERNRCFYVEGVRYDVEVTLNIQYKTELIVCMIPRGLDVERPQANLKKVSEIPLKGPIPYSKIIFELPKQLAVQNRDLLATLSREVLLVGNNWMNEKAMKCIREASDDTHRSLYEYMRTIVTDTKILDGFVFSVLLDDEDFVVLDETATRSAMSLAANSAWKLGRSPADLAVQAMTQVIHSADSVIVDAAQNQTVLDFDLTTDKYYQTDNSFAESMRAVWGASMSCYPIIREGRMLLVALFRTEYKSLLEPLLDIHRESLERIAKEKVGNFKTILQKLTKISPSGWASTLGEFSGTFAASFMKHFRDHGA